MTPVGTYDELDFFGGSRPMQKPVPSRPYVMTLRGHKAHLPHPDVDRVTLCGRLVFDRPNTDATEWCRNCTKEANHDQTTNP